MPSLLYEAVRIALVAACAAYAKKFVSLSMFGLRRGYGTERTENPHDYYYLDCLSVAPLSPSHSFVRLEFFCQRAHMVNEVVYGAPQQFALQKYTFICAAFRA